MKKILKFKIQKYKINVAIVEKDRLDKKNKNLMNHQKRNINIVKQPLLGGKISKNPNLGQISWLLIGQRNKFTAANSFWLQRFDTSNTNSMTCKIELM